MLNMDSRSSKSTEQTENNEKKKDIEMQPLLEKNDGEQEQEFSQTSLKHFLLLIALACLTRFLVAVSKMYVQALQNRVPAFQLNTFRCFLPLCCWSLYFAFKRKLPRIDMGNIKACALWSLNQSMMSISSFISVIFIPLATVETVYISSNILSSLIVFSLILKHDSHWSQVSSS